MNLSFQVKGKAWREGRSGAKWRRVFMAPPLGFESTQTHVVQSTKAQLLHLWVLVAPTPTSYNTF